MLRKRKRKGGKTLQNQTLGRGMGYTCVLILMIWFLSIQLVTLKHWFKIPLHCFQRLPFESACKFIWLFCLALNLIPVLGIASVSDQCNEAWSFPSGNIFLSCPQVISCPLCSIFPWSSNTTVVALWQGGWNHFIYVLKAQLIKLKRTPVKFLLVPS